MEDHFSAEFESQAPPIVDVSVNEVETIGSIAEDSQTRKRSAEDSPSIKPPAKRRAPCWKHFIITYEDDKGGKVEYATCKYCEKVKYKAKSGYGTSNATKHLEVCSAYKAFCVDNPLNSNPYDHKVFCQLFPEAILYHAYPLRIVEHDKLRALLTYLNNKVQHITRKTILRYCMLEHQKLKLTLSSKLRSINSRICFTCDCWSAITKRGYLTLTAHYIDNDWVLRSHILNFRYFPPPHRGYDIYAFVLGLLKEWGLEGKAFSMTVDNATSMDVMINRLKSDLHSFSHLPCMGKYFHVRCCAHVLNIIVQCGLNTIDDSVTKLREEVLYIGSSDLRKCKFEVCVKDSSCSFVGSLKYDVSTRWNSTYHMLKTTLKARDALDLFANREPELNFRLSPIEWDTIEFICKFLEPFDVVTNLFSGSDYPTANHYLANVVMIEKWLVLAHSHQIPSIKVMCADMMEKYEKYWSEHSIILSVAVLLDPRYKLHLVKHLYSLLYVPHEVEARVKEVHDAFIELYKFYNTSNPSTSVSTLCAPPVSSSDSHEFSLGNLFQNFEATNSSEKEAEFAVSEYLNSPLSSRSDPEFDVLNFWKAQSSTYPVLAQMAKDILAIPITSVASESSFSMGGRVLTKYRSSLLPKNVEAFVTTQNWLFGYLQEEKVEDNLDVLHETETETEIDSNSDEVDPLAE